MIDPVTSILGGLVIALSTGVITKRVTNGNKMTDEHCKEKQEACQALIVEKIDNLGKKVDALAKVVNNKILGL